MEQSRRRAARVRGKIDYAKLHGAELQSDDEHQADLSHLAQVLLSYGAYAPKSCCIMAPSDITGELISNSFSEPVLVPPSSTAVQLLGMVLPAPASLTVPEVVKTLGYEKMVGQVISIASQGEGPKWNLYQWLQYWCTRQSAQERKLGERKNSITSLDDEADSRDAKRRDWEAKSKNINLGAWVPRGISAESRRRLFQASVPIHSTPLEDDILSPRAVRDSNLVERFWPSHPTETAQQRPRVDLQLSMAPAGGFCNFRMGPGGSATWLHVISGAKVFALLPPNQHNLGAYVSWASSARQAGVFLPEHAEHCLKVEVPAGASLFIPGGWVYAEASPADCVAIGGHFLHAGALHVQLQVALIEEHLALRRQHRFPHFYQVLWHTAAAYARRLVELCPLGSEDMRERVAEKARMRRAAEAAADTAKAEQAAKAAAMRVASADRKARQQTGTQASPAEPGQQPVATGHWPATDPSGINRPPRHAQSGAVPQKRQRRVSQRMQEAMEDPEAEFEPATQSGGHNKSPPRATRRQLGRLRDGSASGSDIPEDEDEEESSDEELRAMAKIRRRRQQQQAAGQPVAAAPRVRLRTGGRAAAEEVSAPKLRLKLSAAAAAQPMMAGGTGRAGKGRARRQLDDDSDDDVADAEAAEQLARQPNRTTSLKLKLKLSGSAAGIPQVDGTADDDEEASDAALEHEESLDEAEDEGQQVPLKTAAIDVRTDTAAPLDEGSQEAPRSALREGPKDVGLNGLFSADVSQEAGAAAEAALPVEADTRGDDDRPKQRDMATAAQPGPNGAEDAGVGRAAHATNKSHCHITDGLKAEDELEGTACAHNGTEGASGHQSTTKEGGASAGALYEAAVAPVAPSAAAPSSSGADAEQPPSPAYLEAEQTRPDDGNSELRSESGHELPGDVQRRAAKPLSEKERTGISGLVHALRRWLRDLGGHAPANMEDPESMLDEMEVCLEAMGICLAAVSAPVDFDQLPVIKLRDGLEGIVNGSQEDSAGGGTGLQGDSDDEQVEEDPQEELGDSTLEAQARGTKRQGGSTMGGRGGVKKKPSVRDRITKKLRIK
ncbi:g3148 [Coccomyxa elongata]